MAFRTAKSAVKDALRNAKDKAFTSKVVFNGARKVIKDIVDFLDANPAQAAPCLLGLKDGMFDLGDVTSSAADAVDTFASSACYIRLPPLAVLQPILADLGQITEDLEEALHKANKMDKNAYIKLFCFIFCESGNPTPTSRATFIQIYSEWGKEVQQRTPTFAHDGGVDWSKGAFSIEEEPGGDGNGPRIKHVSGAEAPRHTKQQR
jgi:hypothetical protein